MTLLPIQGGMQRLFFTRCPPACESCIKDYKIASGQGHGSYMEAMLHGGESRPNTYAPTVWLRNCGIR